MQNQFQEKNSLLASSQERDRMQKTKNVTSSCAAELAGIGAAIKYFHLSYPIHLRCEQIQNRQQPHSAN